MSPADVPPALVDDEPAEAEREGWAPAWSRARLRRTYDVVAVVVLLGAAYWVRRGTLPGDGLWFDDSWVATGGIHGSPLDLLVVGSGHPGFTGLLMAVHRLGSGSVRALGVPSLVAGVLAPAMLYLALCRTRYERSIATLLAAALVVAPIPALYAGRVKGYTLDTLAVLALAVVVPVVARRRWGWPFALGWALAMVVAGSLSGYILLASAAATAIVALHPMGDRAVRVGALVAQGVVQLVYLRIAESKTDLKGIEQVMEDSYDGHMDLFLDPRSMFHELMKHLRRIAEVYPGGSNLWLSVFAVLSLVGLLLAAFRGRRREEVLTGRFLLLAFTLAAAGSVVDRFPFGPHNDGLAVFSPGGRHTLWILPAFAFGLAALASRARRLVARTDTARLALDGLLVLASVVLVVGRYEPAPPAPAQGSDSATRFIDGELGPDDLAVITGTATFAFANATDRPVHLEATPTHQVGYAPVYDDPRILTAGSWAAEPLTRADLEQSLVGRDRVLVMGSGPMAGANVRSVDAWLQAAGFELDGVSKFGWALVQDWRRRGGP